MCARLPAVLSLAFLLSATPVIPSTHGAEPPQERPSLSAVYFGDINCAHCDTIVDGLIPALEEHYRVTLEVEAFDVLQSRHEADLRGRLAELGLTYRVPPVLLVGNNAYQGNYAIETRLREEIEHFLRYGEVRPFNRALSETRLPGTGPRTEASSPGNPGVLRYFWGVGCPYCELAAPFIDGLEERYPGIKVERYEVFRTREHHGTFRETIAWYGGTSTAVPQIFFGDQGWVGFSERVVQQVEEAVRDYVASGVSGGGTTSPVASEPVVLPLFGTLEAGGVPVALMTAAIAFVDGFNPCSLWVLTLLLGLIVHTRSRRRILLVGGVFLLVTAGIYGLFMLGLLSVFALAGNTFLIRILVGLVAVTMGLINVKDYFFFRKGISLTIPERFKRRITAGTRMMATATAGTMGLAAMTALFAAGIAVVELPCTAGFPVIWSRYVTAAVASRGAFYAFLGLYLLVYLLLEILILAVALVTMGRIGFGERQARPIKLAGGMLMVSLGVFYVADPEIAGSLAGVGRIFLVALLGSALVATAGSLVQRFSARPSQQRQPDPADL